MKNCLLCKYCIAESDLEEDYFFYDCCKRKLYDDGNFPYKNTKCKEFAHDCSIESLTNKEISTELLNLIDWEVV